MQNILIAVLATGLLVTIFALMRKKETRSDDTGLRLLLEQMNELSRVVDRKMGESAREMGESLKTQFSESQRLATDIRDLVYRQLNEVAKGVAETNASTRQVFTIAEQLQNLEKVLKHQKQRGNLGEASLELILSNILPPNSFKMQYEFQGGETVDAAIFVKEGILPIDAKFSLDNYNRLTNETDDNRKTELEKEFKNDLKKRIDETAKYVRPKDGTLPYAFMYIPAEGIYYDLIINEVGSVKANTRNLIDYAYNEKKVIIVSPTTFAAYLQSVLYGLKNSKIEENAKEIIKNVENLSRHIKSYEDFYKKLGNSLSTTVNHYTAGAKELGKIEKDVLRITGESMDLELPSVDRPAQSSD